MKLENELLLAGCSSFFEVFELMVFLTEISTRKPICFHE